MRQRPKSLKPKAKVPVAPKSPKDEDARVRDLEKRLAEALKRESEAQRQLQARNRELVEAHEQQTATSEILRLISSSPTDAQPVFDAIAISASRLLGGTLTALTHVDDDLIHLVAHNLPGWPADQLREIERSFPRPLDDESPPAIAIRSRQMFSSADVPNDSRSSAAMRAVAAAAGYRRLAIMPMLHEGRAIGTLQVGRADSGSFSDVEISLLQTFAHQAVIAIENVRLFKELKASNRDLTTALEQQTATSELLKVIGQSTFDLRPVFQTLAENAVRLCEAGNAAIYQFDGQVLRIAAAHNGSRDVSRLERELLERYPIPLGRHSGAARAALSAAPSIFTIFTVTPTYAWRTLQAPEPVRSVLALPILRANELLGAIVIYRGEVRPFTDSHIALLQTFADQAVIAIENVRLFTELQARTQELTRSVGQLTALGEVGRAVSSTLDLETVLLPSSRGPSNCRGSMAAWCSNTTRPPSSSSSE